MTTRDMTNAPDHLYNLYMTYDLKPTGTQFAVFYTMQGDALIAGAAESDGHFVPNVYAKGYGTLNASLSQKLGEYFRVQLQAKNLTNPDIQTVYRGPGVPDGDVTKTSYSLGIDFSISLTAQFRF
jgi:outer membrane receptor protein involved in Fe transport